MILPIVQSIPLPFAPFMPPTLSFWPASPKKRGTSRWQVTVLPLLVVTLGGPERMARPEPCDGRMGALLRLPPSVGTRFDSGMEVVRVGRGRDRLRLVPFLAPAWWVVLPAAALLLSEDWAPDAEVRVDGSRVGDLPILWWGAGEPDS